MSSKSLNRFGRLSTQKHCARQPTTGRSLILPVRTLTTTSSDNADVTPTSSTTSNQPPPPSSNNEQTLTAKQHALLTKADPNTAHTRRLERILMRQGNPPIGSRRRRAAISSSQNLPFEQLPYQCFQEARKVLLEDRTEKLSQIVTQRARIERLKQQDVGRSRSALVLCYL